VKQLTNPYWAIFLVPLAIFILLIYWRTDPDIINLWGRGGVFALLAYISARYVGRAPVLVWEKDTTPEARNIVGWAIVLIGFMLQISYGWIYIRYDRPIWLSSQYWGASFIILIGVGLAVVASSIPKLPPFGGGRHGLSDIASVAVVFVSALGVFIMSHVNIPTLVSIFKGIWSGLLSAA